MPMKNKFINTIIVIIILVAGMWGWSIFNKRPESENLTPLPISMQDVVIHFNEAGYTFSNQTEEYQETNDNFQTYIGDSPNQNREPALLGLVNDDENDALHIIAYIWSSPTEYAYYKGFDLIDWVAARIFTEKEWGAFHAFLNTAFKYVREGDKAKVEDYQTETVIGDVHVYLRVIQKSSTVVIKFTSIDYVMTYQNGVFEDAPDRRKKK